MYEEANPFIGHESEIDTFRKFLNEEGPQGPSVLFFHEEPDASMPKGGIGKSWVLRECTHEVARHDDLKMVGVDFFSIQDRDGIVIARRIVDALRQLFTDWYPDQFEVIFEHYQQTQQAGQKNRQTGHLIELRRKLHTVLRQELDKLQQRLGSNRKRLFVFCDTYERVVRYPNALSLLPTRHFLETYHIPAIAFVMAGRNEPDWKSMYWHNYRQHVQPIIVPPFTRNEIIQYLQEHLMISEREQDEVLAEVATLHRLTQGRPILVGLLVDLLNDHDVQLEQVLEVKQSEFERYLVEKVHAGRDPGSWAVLLMAHIHHRFNQHMLDWLFCHLKFKSEVALPATIEKAWKKLQGYSFVRLSTTTNDIALHDEMRRMVVEHIWQHEDKPKGISRQELSESSIEYYDHAIAAEENALLRQSYEIEQLYHKLYLDPVGNFALFREQMESALQLKQNNRARPLFQEMQELVTLFSEEQRYQMEEFEARLLQNKENFEGALSIYERLLALTEKPWIRERQGDLWYSRNQYERAIVLLQQAIELVKAIGQHRQQAEWQVELVEMLRQTDRTEEAMPLLEEAEALATRYHYYKLLGQIARIRGDHAYEVGDYRVAFYFYTNFCYYMMLYNTGEYTNAVQETVIKRTYEIPDTVIRRQIWQQLHDAWAGLYLEEEASVMMQTLEEVKLLLNL